MDGGEGNDHHWGGGGRDTFVMGEHMGYDRIHDFNANQDKLDVGAHFSNANQVFNNAHENKNGVVISFGGNEKVLLMGASLDDLDAGNFVF